MPSSAKNSVCNGTNNSSATTNDITVNKLSDGGQSINIFSYLENILLFLSKICFSKKALFGSSAISTSSPDKLTFEPIKSRFLTQVAFIHFSGLL